MIDAVYQACVEHIVHQVVSDGKRSILLNDSDDFWIVLHGSVDLLVARLRDGRAVGQPRSLGTMEGPCVIVGLDAPDASHGLLVRGQMGVRLLRIERVFAASVWDRLRAVPGAEDPDGWLLRWVARVHEAASPGGEAPLAPSETVAIRTERDWDVRFGVLDRLFRSALQAQASGRGTSGGDGDRVDRMALLNHQVVDDAIRDLARVMDDGAWRTPRPTSSRQALADACSRVADACGIPLVHPAGDLPTDDPDALEAIAQASGFRTRRVRLTSTWWRRDVGPLVAWFGHDCAPVALVPGPGGRGYRMYRSGDTDAFTEVDANVAADLHPHAYTFSRPLPDADATLWTLLRFGLRGGGASVRLILALTVGVGLMGLVIPISMSVLFDVVIPAAERGHLVQLALAMLVCVVVSGLFEAVRSVAFLRLESRAEAVIQAGVWDRLLRLPVSFFRDFTAGQLAAKADSVTEIRQILSRSAVVALFGGATASFNVVLLFVYDAELALLALGLVAVAVAVAAVAGRRLLTYYATLVDLRMRLTGTVLQFITGIAKLRVAGAEPRAFRQWASQFGRQRNVEFRARRLGIALEAFNAAFPIVATLFLYAALAARHSTNDLSTGALIAFLAAFTVLLGGMLQLTNAVINALQVMPLFENLVPIIESRPEGGANRKRPRLTGDVHLKDVTFRYGDDGPAVLRDVSLHVAPGEFVAIVGASGSGKSTLLHLLAGFHSPDSGVIRYDGHDLQTLDVQALRGQMGVVLQDAKLMMGDICTNIVGGRDVQRSEAWRAAALAGIARDIEAMPMDMNTTVTHGGTSFSGGQRQRILLARAIHNQPRLFLLDEATSALDNNAQATVIRSLHQLRATRIVVAHRLSTIRHADRIVVLEAGRVVQTGTYDELIGVDGPFADLARRQMH